MVSNTSIPAFWPCASGREVDNPPAVGVHVDHRRVDDERVVVSDPKPVDDPRAGQRRWSVIPGSADVIGAVIDRDRVLIVGEARESGLPVDLVEAHGAVAELMDERRRHRRWGIDSRRRLF
jgi:hypothetical protein